MKRISYLLAVLFISHFAYGQLNAELLGRLDYDSKLNDIWGYTAPDGTEYALVGLRSGVSIVSLEDPFQPEEVFFIPGAQSAWRDLKTWDQFAYVVADQPGTKEGLLVIDLGPLPDDPQFYNWTPVLPGASDSLFTCHNLWIDEKGFVYLQGCNPDTSNVIFLNLNDDPFLPAFAGYGADVYSHDGYARDDLFYSAELLEGQFAIYDVSDKSGPVLLATQETPFQFTHNVWLSDDGNTLFTTDEKKNASTAAYDISDFDDIRLLDEYRPAGTLNTGVIPHNVHVLNEFLIISHYTDGLRIVDAHRPDNLVETGHYDTNQDFTTGFHGAWGAYPFFPSGLIAVSDIENGLYVIQPDYVRASYLEGKVTDASTGMPLPNVEVVIQSIQENTALSNLSGQYKTGVATAGSYDVLFHAKGYFAEIVQVELTAGEVTLLDVELTPLPPHAIDGIVVERADGQPIGGVKILLENEDFSYTTETAGDGRFTIPAVLQGTYSVYLGKWGYENVALNDQLFEASDELRFELHRAYEDNFNTDLGWSVSGDATSGIWERGVPRGTKFAGDEIFNPFEDSPRDSGPYAYQTGNQGGSVFDDEVENGVTVLTSPAMELRSRYNRPLLTYDYWFYNVHSNNAPNDSMAVLLSNGIDTIELALYTPETNVQEWTPSPVFDLADLIAITDNMQLIVRASDRAGSANVIEGGLDNFRIAEGIPDERLSVDDDRIRMRAFPNPFVDHLRVDYKVEKDFQELDMLVVDVLGRVVEEVALQRAVGSVELTPDYVAAPYFIVFRIDGKLTEATAVIKGY